MNQAMQTAWCEANQRYLARAIAEVRAAIERVLRPGECHEFAGEFGVEPEIPALENLCSGFELSSFERKVLLMCAGAEMDSRLREIYAASGTQPTFSLALSAFEDAHWSALSSDRPLRYWQLVELRPGDAITTRPLAINERILHYLAGVPAFEERLAAFIRRAAVPGDMVPSHRKIAEAIADLWSQVDGGGRLATVELCGEERGSKRTIASHAAAMLGLRLHVLPAWQLTHAAADLEILLRLWEREAVLSSSALLAECDEADDIPGQSAAALNAFLENVRCPLFISTRIQRQNIDRRVARFEVLKPTVSEQSDLWQAALRPRFGDFNGHVETLTSQFSLSARSIDLAAEHATKQSGDAALALWDSCRVESRPRLDGLAQRIQPVAHWDDLVLPAKQKEILHQIAVHVRHRAKVYRDWGFEDKYSRGLGISALFAGASGTGKTMAAEVLANDLRLDLYRIDLSQVVSKYIGETEKNLRRVFDAAEQGTAILLFDEADALFGKRSEVKDSHDRYANIEVSYLLQRMEAYRGLAILTTNRKNALDHAFLRRIRFVVEFPFPDAAERAEIWRRVFPGATPMEDLRIEKLARLNLAGGNIRSIALNAAFLAAEGSDRVRMSHLLSAARQEFAKIEKPLTDAEVAGWV